MSDHGTITLVPSVHFSPTHRRRVRETIRETDPDLVAVELDERRFDRIERRHTGDPAGPARDLPPPTAAAYATMRAIQRTVVRLFGLDPTETDMEAAIETAAERDLDVALIDDPIAETVGAIAARVDPFTIPKSMVRIQMQPPRERREQFELLASPLHEVESGDDVQPAIDQFRRLLPEIAEVVIDRRDRAMARRLHALRCEGYDVVAVIGAGHHNGVRRGLDDLAGTDVDPAASVPVRSPSRTVTKIPIE